MVQFLIRFLILLLTFFEFNLSVYALEVIYPQKSPYYTNAKETFIVGNVNKKSKLFVNDKPLKVWKNGMFCYTPTLNNGQNNFIFVEKNRKTRISKEFSIIKNSGNPISTQKKQKTEKKIFNKTMSAFVRKDNTPIRNQPSENGRRITHLQMNTNLLIQAEYGNWYKLYDYDLKEPMWISKNQAEILSPVENIIMADISDIEFYQDEHFLYFKFNSDLQNPYKIVENKNSLDLTLYNVNETENLELILETQNILKKISKKSYENNNLTLTINFDGKLWGYDAEYYGNSFIFKLRKSPVIDKHHPLKGLTIAIDAGHGGDEKGALGCAKIDEKTINLEISLKLKKILEKQGAKVVMTREKDEYIEIYRRPEIAKINNAIICLSIHANSMIDGNPYKKHGTGVFYYNEQAKELAMTIKNEMVKDLNFRDDGVKYASFVLTRPTMPVSILIETAYMPNPDEYEKLTNSNFQKRIAKSVSEGLKHYLSGK